MNVSDESASSFHLKREKKVIDGSYVDFVMMFLPGTYISLIAERTNYNVLIISSPASRVAY